MYSFFRVSHDVFKDERFRGLRLSSKYFYCYLAKLRNNFQDKSNGWLWRSMAQLSEEVGVNMKTLKRAKKELLQNNFIEVKRGKYNGTNRRSADWYRLLGCQGEPLIDPNKDSGSGC